MIQDAQTAHVGSAQHYLLWLRISADCWSDSAVIRVRLRKLIQRWQWIWPLQLSQSVVSAALG